MSTLGSHWKSGHYSYELHGGVYSGQARAPPGCPGVERQFFGALDGEEFFAIEGSHAN